MLEICSMNKETILQCPISLSCWVNIEVTGNLTTDGINKLIQYLEIIKTTVPSEQDNS